MKSTQKFLCYSLALVGAALIFSAGCKKGDVIKAGDIIANQKPVLNYPNGPSLTGTTSATVQASDNVALAGSSSITALGFNYVATAISWTGATTPTAFTTPFNGSVTVTVMQQGAFSSTLYSVSNTALVAALSGSVTVTWVVRSFVTNGAGTTYSALTNTITTTN